MVERQTYFDPQKPHRPDGFLLHPDAGRAAHTWLLMGDVAPAVLADRHATLGGAQAWAASHDKDAPPSRPIWQREMT
jgi:hypothetical protein